MTIGKEITISEKLKNYRRINCLSQEKLAETSGISIRTIQRIEEGKSIGSAYTLTALAKALNINLTEFMNSVSENPEPVYNNTNKLKMLNFSAIAMLLIPLSNIVFPVLIYFKNRDNKNVKDIGGKIISFQIFWTLGTLIGVIFIPILLLLFSSFMAASIPLFIPVYFISAFLNIYFVIRFAININKQTPFLEKIPNIL